MSDNNTQMRKYERVPDRASSNLQIGWNPCPHGVSQWPGTTEVCGICSSPWNGGYECDSCGHTGGAEPRYACTVCPDYDICQTCNDNDVHTHHTLTQVKHVHQLYEGVHPDSAKRPRGDARATLAPRRDNPKPSPGVDGRRPQQQPWQPRVTNSGSHLQPTCTGPVNLLHHGHGGTTLQLGEDLFRQPPHNSST